jgi:hypothetical protein
MTGILHNQNLKLNVFEKKYSTISLVCDRLPLQPK